MKPKTRFAVFLFSLAGLPILVVAALLVALFWDDPPVQDADLRPRREAIPDAENAFTHFERALANLSVPGPRISWEPALALAGPPPEPDEEARKERHRLDEMAEGKAWDEPLARRALGRNEAALALWERGLAAPRFQVPEVRGYDDPVGYAYDFFTLARLGLLRSRARQGQGDVEGAVADALRVIRFGHGLEGAQGSVVTYLVGSTIKGMGRERLQDLVRESPVAPARLRALAAELAPYGADAEGLAEALRAEYVVEANMVDLMRAGKITVADIVLMPGRRSAWAAAHRMLWRVGQRVLFKPERTKRLFADALRPFIAAADQPFSRLPPDPLTDQPQGRWPAQFVSTNAIGRMVVAIVLPGIRGVQRLKCLGNVRHAALRLDVAVRAFQSEKGRLPETLDALVPEYLEAVPPDDFDGRPMRYDPARKLVYSVGEDLRDDGAAVTLEEFLARKRQDRGLDGPDVAPEDLEDLRLEFDAWDLPDPCFPVGR